ncbi:MULTISPECIES: BTAD domain-containing putative transcriptional regulator [unclassified Streptomyces]|uniref:BTAD domain-containing putative transcriptional regulator n=1 Tax=unclassified Streptomyces TaxID=2593676 RepID=UPI0033F69A56
MQFNLLGPLTVVHQGQTVLIRGLKQRAALGILLLHANRTVATSRLLTALWGDDVPPTARKGLQNVVAGLRRALHSATDTSVALETRPHGYVLRVPEQDIDWCRHQALVEQGRAEMAAGAREPAVALLREALGLWRGPVLADLVEAGVDWPETGLVRSARLDVLEDCVEAELAAGSHHELVAELLAEYEANPARERLCGQLMLALYRCGRHAEALSAYRRTRDTLARELGLDPGRALRDLEQSILNHDASLLPASGDTPAAPWTADRGEREPGYDTPPVSVEWKLVSVLMVRAHFDPHAQHHDPECVAEGLRLAGAAVRDEVRRHGGVVTGVIGSMWQAAFGVPRSQEDIAERAMRAALAVQRRLGGHAPNGVITRMEVSAAVTTGEALLSRHCGGDRRIDLTGGVLDRCQQLLDFVRPGTIRVCDTTARAGHCAVVHSPAVDQLGGWLVTGLLPSGPASTGPAPFTGRGEELGALRGRLDAVRTGGRPHLVTVVGPPGSGRSRLVAEFAAAAGAGDERVRRLVGRVPPFREPARPGLLGGLLASYAGIGPDDPPEAAQDRLDRAVRALAGTARTADWLMSRLAPLALPRPDGDAEQEEAQALPAWRRFLEELATDAPLTVIIDDLHLADDAVLDLLDDLASPGSVPVLIVATARPELLQRRPRWGQGRPELSTLLLEPLPEDATAELFDAVLSMPPLRNGAGLHTRVGLPSRAALMARIDGNPRFAVEYAEALRDGTPLSWELSARTLSQADHLPDATGLPVPQSVYSIIATRLDTLPDHDRAVLQDAAALGTRVTAAAVAAVGGRDHDEAAHCLRHLEQAGLLRRVPAALASGDQMEYAFRTPLVRCVAYVQLPRTARVAKYRRAAAWHGDSGAEFPDQVIPHEDPLASRDGCTIAECSLEEPSTRAPMRR